MHTSNTPNLTQNCNFPNPSVSANFPNQISDPRVKRIRAENLKESASSTPSSLAGRGAYLNATGMKLKQAIEQLHKAVNIRSYSQIQAWFTEYSSLFELDDNLNCLSNFDAIHLDSLFAIVTEALAGKLILKVKKRIDSWPLGVQFKNTVNEYLNSFSIFLASNTLSTEEKYSLLAIYAEKHGYPISSLKKIPGINWEEFSPYLSYVDLRGIEELSFIEAILKNCHNANVLLINNNKIKKLGSLPNLQRLDCSGCKALTHIETQPKLLELDCSIALL